MCFSIETSVAVRCSTCETCDGIQWNRSAPPMSSHLDPRIGSIIFDNIPHGIFTVDQ